MERNTTTTGFRLACLLLLFVLGVVFSSCGKDVEPSDVVPSTSITLSKRSVNIYAGTQLQLEARVLPENATDKKVIWTSSGPEVVSVDESGLVSGLSAGTANVKAVNSDLAMSCKVTVWEREDPGTDPEDPGTDPEDPGTDPEDPGTNPLDHWQDTGADVPVYPSYNAVSSLEDFPRVDITVSEDITSKETWVTGTIVFKDPKGMYSDVEELSVPMKIRGRGNSTWNLVDQGVRKNPYRLKLDKKQKVFGMKSDKNWDLLAELMDPSLMRNMVSQRIARVVSMPWSPRFRTVELYMNGAYQGCYTLFEHKETGDSKVAVSPVGPDKTDGGYFLELDEKNNDDENFFSTGFSKQFNYKDPEAPSADQRKFIEGKINDLEKALIDKKFSGAGCYRDMIEMDSFIQNYIVQELTMNVDGNMRLSTYWAKDWDTQLFIALCWDFDLALGNATYLKNDFALDSNGPLGWFIKIRGGTSSHNNGQQDTYYQYMFQDPVFVERLKKLWNLYKPRLDNIPEYIDRMQEYNALAYGHNVDAGKNGRVRSWGVDNETFFSSSEDAVGFVKSFYSQRLAWLDSAINGL